MKNPERVAQLLAELQAECEYRFEFDAFAKLEQTISELPRVIVIDDNHQEFRGKKYYYRSNAGYFYGKIGTKTVSLHREVWKHFFGDIPEGFVIHHIDNDKSNNNIENLKLMSRSEHTRNHNSGVCRAMMKTFVCEYCGKEFESHDVGRNKFCSQTCNVKAFRLRHPMEKTCAYCGKIFITYNKKTRYCSNRCESCARYSDRREDRICPVCGKSFSTTKIKDQKCCSHSCAQKLVLKELLEKSQSNS